MKTVFKLCIFLSGVALADDFDFLDKTTVRKSAIAKVDDSFVQVVYSQSMQEKLSADDRIFMGLFSQGKFTDAAHFLDRVDSGQSSVKFAKIFLFDKLGLYFSLMKELARVDTKSPLFVAFENHFVDKISTYYEAGAFLPKTLYENFSKERILASPLARWWLLEQIIENPEDKKLQEVFSEFKASHELIPFASTRVIWVYLKNKQMKEASQVLKNNLDQITKIKGTLNGLGELVIARLLYSAKAYEKAESYYRQISSNSPYFFRAQEELSWSLLQQNKIGEAKGIFYSLQNYKDIFVPEVYVTRAIVELKRCDYDSLVTLINEFQTRYQPDVNLLNEEMKKEIVSEPKLYDGPDLLLELYKKKVKFVDLEIKSLGDLYEDSINVPLPAVGKQAHWKNLKTNLESEALQFGKQKNAHHIRIVQGQYNQLKEAIRKMRFIRLELMNQIEKAKNEDRINVSASAIQKKENDKQIDNKIKVESGKQIYENDGVIWSDEIFKYKSLGTKFCSRRKS